MAAHHAGFAGEPILVGPGGTCGWGPVFQIREKFYMQLTAEKVDQIIDELSK